MKISIPRDLYKYCLSKGIDISKNAEFLITLFLARKKQLPLEMMSRLGKEAHFYVMEAMSEHLGRAFSKLREDIFSDCGEYIKAKIKRIDDET